MEAVNIRIGPLVLDHADYDADGDVLYLPHRRVPAGGGRRNPGGPRPALRTIDSHTIVGLTVLNARHVIGRDGRLIVTIPETVEASAADLEAALQASAVMSAMWLVAMVVVLLWFGGHRGGAVVA